MKKFINTKTLYIILLLVSFSILVYFCIDDNNLVTLLNSVNILDIPWLTVACAFMFLAWAIDAKIVKLLMYPISAGKYYFKDAVKVTMVGQFFNSVTPFCIASQPMQILVMSRQGINTGKAISVVVRKFLIYQATLVLYLFLSVIFSFSFFSNKIPDFMSLVILGCFSQSLVVLIILFFTVKRKLTLKIIYGILTFLAKFNLVKNVKEKMNKTEEELDIYVENNKDIRNNLRLTFKVFLLTFLQFTFIFSIPFCIYKVFNNPGFDILDMISGQAFITSTASYMPLPGGSGAMESSFITVFNIFFNSENVKPAMLLWRFITYYFCIIFGMFFALDVKKFKLKKNRSPIRV